ncbi:hypothetical protein [Mucilaginibacter sp. 44-25]|uniref:hypothetical protein n=1 Tax=Mucilaginibacter sp. 44-25 TaxID=1895794 RepID=UPI00095DB14B|nr:hypothetical protein [Mucilaginibacter sp. 44-25]OJW17971.1 MAG: hypothetical protein BGO48_15425 [Mucilaginibacter sp. 44-25]
MRDEFDEQLKVFSTSENLDVSKKYLQKYWLFEKDYLEKWQPIQKALFKNNTFFPEFVFNKKLQIFVTGGGRIFPQSDFESLKICMNKSGDKEFVIIQNINNSDAPQIYYKGERLKPHPFLRFKFPAHVDWKELLSGDGISEHLFEMPFKDYFVFGDSGNWGMYVANDHYYPLIIFGFVEDLKLVFENEYKVSENEHREILKALPTDYLSHI